MTYFTFMFKHPGRIFQQNNASPHTALMTLRQSEANGVRSSDLSFLEICVEIDELMNFWQPLANLEKHSYQIRAA